MLRRTDIAAGLRGIYDAIKSGAVDEKHRSKLKEAYLRYTPFVHTVYQEALEQFGARPGLLVTVLCELNGVPCRIGDSNEATCGADHEARAADEENAGDGAATDVQVPVHPRTARRQRLQAQTEQKRLLSTILGWKLRDDEGVKAPEFGQVTAFPLVSGPRATASQFLGATQEATASSIAAMKEGTRVVAIGASLDEAVEGFLALSPDGQHFVFRARGAGPDGEAQIPAALVAGLCVDTPHFVLPPELRYQPLPLAVLGIAFSKSASTGAAAFTLPVAASPKRQEGSNDTGDDDGHSTLAPDVSLFRFAVASEKVATTWIVGVTCVVAALAAQQDRLSAPSGSPSQGLKRAFFQACRMKLLHLAPTIGILSASASVCQGANALAARLRRHAEDESDSDDSTTGRGPTCWLPLTVRT